MDPILFSPVSKSRIKRFQQAIRSLPGLVAYYPLNELSGNIAYNRAATLQGNLNGSIIDATLGLSGLLGKSYSFDGINDYIDLGSNSNLVVGNGDWTFGAFIYHKSDTTLFPLASRIGASASGYDILATTTGKITVRVGDDAGHNVQNNAYQIPGTFPSWHLTIGVIDRTANLLKQYVDGVLINNSSDISTFNSSISNSQNPFIGKRNTSFFNSSVQHVFFLKRAITITEVAKIARMAGLA